MDKKVGPYSLDTNMLIKIDGSYGLETNTLIDIVVSCGLVSETKCPQASSSTPGVS